jgi:Ni/Co efflux regulator RcnB
VAQRITGFVLADLSVQAAGGLIVLVAVAFIALWVANVDHISAEDRKTRDREALERRRLEAENRELRKQAKSQERWSVGPEGLQYLRSRSPHTFPPLLEGQTPEEYWRHWQPPQVDEWRRQQGIVLPGTDAP